MDPLALLECTQYRMLEFIPPCRHWRSPQLDHSLDFINEVDVPRLVISDWSTETDRYWVKKILKIKKKKKFCWCCILSGGLEGLWLFHGNFYVVNLLKRLLLNSIRAPKQFGSRFQYFALDGSRVLDSQFWCKIGSVLMSVLTCRVLEDSCNSLNDSNEIMAWNYW